jgi:hypothetical protein
MGNQFFTNAAATATPKKKRPFDSDNARTKAGEWKSRRTSADESQQLSPEPARYNWPPDTLRTPYDMQPLGDVAPVTDVALVGRQTSPGASIETSQRVVPSERMNEKVPNSHRGNHLAAPGIAVAEVAVVTPDRTTLLHNT